MVSPLRAPKFELRQSPWLQRAVNERYRWIFGFWHDVHKSFLPEKNDIEDRVRYILEHNDRASLIEFASHDRAIREGMAGPKNVVDPDPARVAAFRLVELATDRAISDLRSASILPALKDDLVCEKTPGLWALLDPKHHLLPITRETWPTEINGNVPFFTVGERVVYPHPLIWPNRELMADVVTLGLDGFDAKIAIDPSRSSSRDDRVDELLADYWFGCHLTMKTIDSLDRRDLGETWHMRPADRETTLTSLPLAATVFRWSADGHLKKLEVVEITPRDSCGDGVLIVNRYLHALRDTTLKRFIHVDGAVRAYDPADYQATRENPQGPIGEPIHYRKLFRVDGVLEDDMWGRVLAHWFRGNELVIEYFGESLDDRGWAPRQTEVPTSTVPAMAT